MNFKIKLDWEREKNNDDQHGVFFETELEIKLNEDCDGIHFNLYQIQNNERFQPNLQNYGSFLGLKDFPEGTSMTTYYNLICESFSLKKYEINDEKNMTFNINISLQHDICKEIVVIMSPHIGKMFQDIAYELRTTTLIFRDILLGSINLKEDTERLQDQMLQVWKYLEKKSKKF